MAEDSQGGACVVCCGSKRCKTCDHILVGSTFTSNVTVNLIMLGVLARA